MNIFKEIEENKYNRILIGIEKSLKRNGRDILAHDEIMNLPKKHSYKSFSDFEKTH